MEAPGVADGVLQAWVDGELVLDVQDFIYRTADHDYGIDAMYVSTFARHPRQVGSCRAQARSAPRTSGVAAASAGGIAAPT